MCLSAQNDTIVLKYNTASLSGSPVYMNQACPTVGLVIVDDDNVVLDLLSDLLGRKYHIRCAHDAFEAIKLLDTELCDVLIVDLELPDMSGLDLVVHLRSDPRTRHIPIIVMSAYHELLNNVSHDDVQAIIKKPFSTKEFARTVENVLGRQAPPQPGTTAPRPLGA